VKHEALTQQLIAAFYTIYNELGHGFLESMYQKAFSVVLGEKGLRFQEQAPIEVVFQGVPLGDFKADLLVDSSVLIELKAAKTLEDAHERQVLNYLKATNIEVALLFNFGPRPEVRRLVLEDELKATKSVATSTGA
jgi:GxxExxY protein